MDDITVIFPTANKIPEYFAANVRKYLLDSIGDTPLISVSKEPMDFGQNIVFEGEQGHMAQYRETLEAVKLAKTKYIALTEDDTLYVPQHFKRRPSRPDVFAYNTACWSFYMWSDPPIFSYSGRRNNNVLICERDLYIEAMEERFAKYPNPKDQDKRYWVEPGKYEKQLGVTIRNTEIFYSDPACIMVSHQWGNSFGGLGTRKRLGPIRAYEIPYWGRAEDVMKLVKKP